MIIFQKICTTHLEGATTSMQTIPINYADGNDWNQNEIKASTCTINRPTKIK